MTTSAIDLANSVVRIPVAGPAPNNTLVYVRAQFPNHVEITGGGVSRWPMTGATLYRIDGFSQAHADDYRRHTKFSVAAWLNYVKNPEEQDFVVAIDDVSASIAADGTVVVDCNMAIMNDDFPGLHCDFWVSAYILTMEPQRDFTRPPIRWDHADLLAQGAKRGPNYSEQRGMSVRRPGRDEALQTPSPFPGHRSGDRDRR